MFKRSLLSLVMVVSFAAAHEGCSGLHDEVVVASSDVSQAAEVVTEQVKELVSEAPVRFASLRNLASKSWNSETVQFACDMVNPAAYGRACKAMVNAGFKGSLPELWNNHKAIIAGTVVVTAAVAVAYKKGLFAKAKAYVLSFTA